MKINSLLEFTTPASDPANATSPAPKFGRSDKFLEEKDETVEESTAGTSTSGVMATGEPTNLGMQRRGKGSMLQGIKTSEKFPNSKSVKEGVDPRNFDSDEDYYDAVRNQGKQKFSGDWDVWDEIASLENQLKYTKSSALAHTLHKQIDQLKSEYGIEDDEQLDEKSVSKAQFRTMAAVAHNPKFAKKVGISQKVGKEFHKADKKQDYKDLPAKVDEEGKGLWANIHAKRERIKSGSGERMRKPGSKGAPTAQNFKDAANEAANPAQQAAIAIAKKKEQGVAEGSEEVDTHGRTKAEWVEAVHAKYPMARVIHNKDNTQVMAVLPNGKEIRWIKDEGIIEQGVAEGSLNEFAPPDSGDDRNYEYEVYQCNPNDQFDWIGGPIYKSDDMGKVHSIAYNLHKKHPDKAFMIWQERSQGSRGGYGIKDDEQGVAEAGEWTKLPNGNWRNMHTGAQQSTPPKTKKPRRTMGLHASLEQHADDKMKELGHKFKPVDEARVGNRMSDISIGSPKIVHYKGKAVGEVGIDHESSPGNGPYYMKHYLTGKDMVGYESKQQALADLKHLVMHYEGRELEEGPGEVMALANFAKGGGIPGGQSPADIVDARGVIEEKQRLDPKCWTGYKKQGTKMKGDTRVNNCVKVDEAELTEEDMLANELFKQLELFKKAQDKGLGSKPQDKDISAKAQDKDIISKDDGEYNDEAGMFKNDLQTIQRVSNHLEKAIQDNENLPEWCQAKIAQAKGMVVNVMDYMISQHENGIVDTLEEEFDLIESIVESIAVRNNVNSEAIWEDLESLTDDELYVFAVTSEPINEDWQKVNKKDKTDGMSPKAVKAYRRENPGSKLKTAVTTKPSKLKKGSKASKRRKSYCSRSRGQMKMHNISCSKTPDKAICKARRRWNC